MCSQNFKLSELSHSLHFFALPYFRRCPKIWDVVFKLTAISKFCCDLLKELRDFAPKFQKSNSLIFLGGRSFLKFWDLHFLSKPINNNVFIVFFVAC